MTDDLEIQDRLRVWAATGIDTTLSPELCRILAERIDLGEESFQAGIKHRKRARRDLLMSASMLVASLVIAVGALLS